MALPLLTDLNSLSLKPRPLAVFATDHVPRGRTISHLLWLDMQVNKVMTRSVWLALPADLGIWDTRHLLAERGLVSGWRYRLAKINTAQPHGEHMAVSMDWELVSTAPVASGSTAWPLPCPMREGFSLERLPLHHAQQFSSGRTRLLQRRRGTLEKCQFVVSLDHPHITTLLSWYAALLAANNPAIAAPWLAGVSANPFIKLMQPWTATLTPAGWNLKMEGVTCANDF